MLFPVRRPFFSIFIYDETVLKSMGVLKQGQESVALVDFLHKGKPKAI
jgi:hypothetical protein